MRFQQLVFRTTPHSLVEWLDGELEKRGIDCVYTHCILSILQEDSDDTEPDECIDVRNNQQKVYHKYGGPESLFSATKSKHQKWKTYSKQILLTGSISSCDVGISDLERKNRNAAINCLKSVSDDNTIEDLIDEVCLRLKNIKNMNALEKKDSVKSTNRVEKETAFYIPPSSPTDQVEKYFAAFPPLNNNFEESCSDQLAHLNAWYNNCLRKNKSIVQDIFKNSQINSENTKNKIDTFCSLKSIENIYQPENNNNKGLNRLKIHNTSKQEGNNFKFSDENIFNDNSVKSNLDDISNTTLTNILSKFRKDQEVKVYGHYTLNITTGKNNAAGRCKYLVTNSNTNYDCKCELDFNKNTAFENSSAHALYCSNCEIKAACLFLHKCLIEENSKPIMSTAKNSENAINRQSLSSDKNNFTTETASNPLIKLKSPENSDTSLKANVFSKCESFDLTPKYVDIKSYEENEDVLVKKTLTSCRKSKHRKKSLSKDNSGMLKNDLNQLIKKLEKQPENKRKDFECSEVTENDSSDKAPEISVEPLKKKSNSKKRKNKSRLKKGYSSLEEENLEISTPERESINSDVKLKDVDVTKVPLSSKTDHNTFSNKSLPVTEGKASVDVQLKASDSFKSEDKDYEEDLNFFQSNVENTSKTKQEIKFHKDKDFEETFNFSQGTVENTGKTRQEIYFEKSNIYFSEGNEEEVAALESNSNNAANLNKNKFTVETKSSTSEINLKLPTYNEIPCRKFIFPFGNINLINIGTNMYYNFDPLRALSVFSEHEIFNIITAGDFNEVNNFLSKFSTPHYRSITGDQDTEIEVKHDANDCLLPSQETLNNFDNLDSRNSIESLPLITISQACSMPKIYCSKLSTSFSLKDLQLEECNDTYSLSSNFCDDVTFNNSNGQKQIVANDSTPVLFGNWDYNPFFDFNKTKTQWASNVTPCDYINVAYPLSISNSVAMKNISDILPGKLICSEDTCNLDISNNFYNEDESKVSSCTAANTNNFVAAFKHVLDDFEGKYMAHLLENENKQIDSFHSFNHSGNVFKPVSEVKQNCVPASFRNSGQTLLKKAINIDRMIQKINGKNRVASFEHLQGLSLSEQAHIGGQILSHPPISILNSTSNFSDKDIETENSMPTDSDWSKQFLMKKENLKSIWEPRINGTDNIWGNPAKDVEKKNCPLSLNKFDIDAIHEEFEKEQDELLRGLYSMPHLKEEIDLPYPFEQNISNQIYGSPYKSNIDLTNESLNINTEEYSEISSVHTMPAQTVSKFSKSNNDFGFSFSGPPVDPVGTFSLENCKSDAVDSQINCSDNYSDYLKNESYHDPDLIDLSAFRGPYGSFSENRTNAIEGGGWSLDSDSYLLESEAFQDQSSSLQDLNTVISENDFRYMQIDRQQFSSEDDEIAKINATRWPSGFMRRRMKHKCPPFKRPCAFYMEGHCNRTDCKFSHELSIITCRFWQEGSCFKGSTCPFLHGYAEDQKSVDRSFHKREPEHNYSLDSEADFPSLSSSKNEKTLVVKSEPVDIVRVKGLKNSRQTNH